MDWGLKNRLSRIIRPDGKTVMLAVDHGYFLGSGLFAQLRGNKPFAQPEIADEAFEVVDSDRRFLFHAIAI